MRFNEIKEFIKYFCAFTMLWVVALILFLSIQSIALAGERTNKWNQYSGKNVKIELYNQKVYTGKVITIMELNECKQVDAFNKCIYKEWYYMIFLQVGKIDFPIPCEEINNIEVIN